MSSVAVYPGSFDPITFGHLSIVKRAAALADELVVLVVHNPSKSSSFDVDSRVEMIRNVLSETRDLKNVGVQSLDQGLLVDKALELKARFIVKGFRTNSDIDYELPMAQVNRDLAGIETVFLPAEPGYGYVSSSLVRQVASLGGDVSQYVPASVAHALRQRCSN